jgi:preprotein translocase subunit SecG
LYTVLLIGSIFMILLILIQKGRGGGLAGALGGMGGYSAFGTRAGDVFTRITIGAASVWFLAAMLLAFINLSGGAGTYKNTGVKRPSTSQEQPDGSPSGGMPPSDDEADKTAESKPPSADEKPNQKPADDKKLPDEPKPTTNQSDDKAADKPAETKSND